MPKSERVVENSHQPVLYHQIIHALQPKAGGLYLDCTLGAGGHAAGILEASSPDGKLLGLDVDPQALALANQRLAPYGERVKIFRASYVDLDVQLKKLGWDAVDGILFDLGLSSMQVDTPERGFSFRKDAALDMRFDPDGSPKAADLVNNLSQDELSEILFKYGEERKANRVARAIIQARPIETTGQLAEIVVGALGIPGHDARKDKTRASSRLHPATRTFQALRIAVNNELAAIEASLPKAVAVLAPGGRLAIIAFHSLEDRIVKRFFRRESRDCICPPRQPICTCRHRAVLVEVTRKPMQAMPEEIRQNPRARSARLRVAEKLPVS